MELVEGPTLAERIARGPVPLDEALGLARQIADALEAAHEKGIVHRDLKPANIKIRPDGSVKVLDFGLAKSGELAELAADSPTMLTVSGMILGTAAYMAPEQAAGQPVDKRADVWAFGIVLHEILSGQRLFQGDSVAHILAEVLRGPIDLAKLPKETPRRIRRLMRRCLDRDLRTRLRDIREARVAIDTADEEPENVPVATRPTGSWMAAVGVLTVLLAGLGFVHFREARPIPAPISATILPPETTGFDFSGQNNIPALSPDGKWIVFGARTTDNKNPLWLRPLASDTAQMLAGTDGGSFPFWSPDSRYVAFFSGGKLKKIDISGGPALTLADASNGRGGSWSPEGVILFAPDNGSPLLRVAAIGGKSSATTSLQATTSRSHRFPWFLPDGHHFLFEDQVDTGVVLRVGALDSQGTVDLGRVDSNAAYSSGHLFFLRENTLMAQPFDAKSRTVQAEAIPLEEGASHVLSYGRVGVFSVSVSGLLVYQAGAYTGGQKLTWFDRNGKAVGVLGDPGNFSDVALSPDRRNAAVSATDAAGSQDIWVYDIARSLRTRFTFGGASHFSAVWAPDGNTIAWGARSNVKRQIYRKGVDGKGTEALLFAGAGATIPTSWSPDGKFLLVSSLSGAGDILSLPLTGAMRGNPLKPGPVVATAFNEDHGVFSPDGHWVAYKSNESQQNEVYAIPFPGPGGKRQISTSGGDYPRWRPDGKDIFFAGQDGKLMAADVTLKAETIEVGPIHPLGIPILGGRGTPYDVSLDGQRFLVVTEPERSASPPLTLVENWTALLKK